MIKSIKEKAEEYTSDITNSVTNCAAFLAYKRGANYVLDEIESLIKHISDEYPLFQQGAIIHIRLIKLLGQLKK